MSGLKSRFGHMDYILLIVGVAVLLLASAISAIVNPYIVTYAGESAAGITANTTLIAQIIGGVMAIAALAGKRVFS